MPMIRVRKADDRTKLPWYSEKFLHRVVQNDPASG